MQLSIAVLAAIASIAGAQKLPVPPAKGSVTLRAPQQVSGTFDGGMKRYGRGVRCSGGEGGEKDAVFVLSAGATLKNVIIGADQKEGVHCKGPCTIENVWWEKVCEDALSIKGDGSATVLGGGAYGATDKVVQHNGFGTVTIDGFTVIDFGKLYRSCGNCKGNGRPRNVVIKNVKAYKGSNLAGINTNFGDRASISGSCATNVKSICQGYQGTTPGNEPRSGAKCSPQTLPPCGPPTAPPAPSGPSVEVPSPGTGSSGLVGQNGGLGGLVGLGGLSSGITTSGPSGSSSAKSGSSALASLLERLRARIG